MNWRDYAVLLGAGPTWLVSYRYLVEHAAKSAPGYPVSDYLPAVGATGLTLVLVLVYVALRIGANE